MVYTIRIITSNSPGLLNDANTYKNEFLKYGFEVDINIIENGDKSKNFNSFKNIDIIFFLETIIDNLLSYAKINLFMPNQEIFIFSTKYIDKIDYVLCKTRIATDFFLSIKKSHKYKYKCVYTKFTTNVPYDINNIVINKDVNLFVHLAGKSSFKNTAILIFCWIKNNGFISIDSDIKLYITCHKKCYKSLLETLLYLNLDIFKENNIERIENGLKIGNLFIFSNKIKDEMYNKLLFNNSLAICISNQEGYGHYINEARYYKSAILTVDHPPMNELVQDNMNGFTIKTLQKKTHKISEINNYSYILYKVKPSILELSEKIIDCIRNKNKLINYGIKGHKMYIKDKRYFTIKMKMFIDYLIKILEK